MRSRRQFLLGCSAVGVSIGGVPVASAANASSGPDADLDTALDAFGAGTVRGHVGPRTAVRLADALDTVAAEQPGLAAAVEDRLPGLDAVTGPGPASSIADPDDALGALADADAFAETTVDAASLPDGHPAVGIARGVESVAVAVDFTARGPVVRARVVGREGTPSRVAAVDVLSAFGFPGAALADAVAVPDGDALTLTRGFDDRDPGQPFVLALFVLLLAAVVGTFVLGFGDQVENTAPQASFTFDFDSSAEELVITHDGGDSIEAQRLRVVDDDTGADSIERRWGSSGEVSAGVSLRVTAQADDRVRVIWESADGSEAATLALWQGPEA